MFKGKILALLLTVLAISLGLVLPEVTAFLQDRKSADSAEPLGMELDELSMSSGLDSMEKIALFSDVNSRQIVITDWEEVEAREMIFSSIFGSVMSAEQRELLLSEDDRMLFVNHVFCVDDMGNQWQIYEDKETGGILGLAMRFYWAEELVNTGSDGEVTAVTNDIMDKMGVNFADGWWAADLVYNMGGTFNFSTRDLGYDTVQGENVIYYEFYFSHQTEAVTISMGYDTTGCWINCDRISWR